MEPVKIIRSEQEKRDMALNENALILPPSALTSLRTLSENLSVEFGFSVTMENALMWMLKQSGRTTPVVNPMDVEAERLMRSGQKINAIKLVREKTQMGLKEAKDYVEQRWQSVMPATY